MKATSPAIQPQLAAAIAKQTERQVRAMQVPYYWIEAGESGNGGQFSDRDLQMARRERLAQKGKD